jgi:outer membrane protein OmpA-like peptidoglycan-associated protein/tetratricopeptide (TPR) repeat protein
MQIMASQPSSEVKKETDRSALSPQLQRANQAYSDLQFALAAEYYEKYLKHVTNVKPAVLKNLADCYWQMRNYTKAYKVYKLLVSKGKETISDVERFRIGELYARFGDYTSANNWLESLPNYAGKLDAYSSEKIKDIKTDSLVWKVENLNLNTPYREFSPLLVDSTLYFSSSRPTNVKKKAYTWDGQSYSRLWQTLVSHIAVVAAVQSTNKNAATNKRLSKDISQKQLAGVYVGSDSQVDVKTLSSGAPITYTQASSTYIGKPVRGLQDIEYNVGSIAIDGENSIYLSANYKKANKKKINRVHLLEGHLSGDSIEDMHAMPFGDPNLYSVMHPAVNNTGTLIIFSSNKPGGNGLYDLYYSKRENKQSPWSTAAILGGKINTPGNEVFPSITSDGYLYYSSDSKKGLGGLDIYRIKLEDALAGTEVEPEHLGYPINSASDDFGWTQSKDGKQVYFTSDRGTSEDNVYRAHNERAAQKAIQANQTKQLEGFVFDRQTMLPIKGVTVFLYNKCNNKVYITTTDEKGKYTSLIPLKCEIVVLAACKGYTKDCMTITANEAQASEEVAQKAPRDLLLDNYFRNFKWKLNNIYYSFNKWDIRSDARSTLDSLIDILKHYPIKVELGSHTDCRGSFVYNDKLSQKRADAAVNYIVAAKIDRNRITAKGYGEHQLVNRCADGISCSETEHQRNRRTEIKVILGQDADMPGEFDPSVYAKNKQVEANQLPANFFEQCEK